MSYGPSEPEMSRRAASYVDIKILNGTRAADLPIERPVEFAPVLKLKAARDREVTIPPSLLPRADEVIR